MTIKCIAYHVDFIYPVLYENLRKWHPMECLKYDIVSKPIKIVISYVDESKKLHIIEQDPEKDKFPEFEIVKSDIKVNFTDGGGYTLTY